MEIKGKGPKQLDSVTIWVTALTGMGLMNY